MVLILILGCCIVYIDFRFTAHLLPVYQRLGILHCIYIKHQFFGPHLSLQVPTELIISQLQSRRVYWFTLVHQSVRIFLSQAKRRFIHIQNKTLRYSDQQRTVNIYGTNKKVQDLEIADTTGRIQLSVWGDLISNIEESKTYKFVNVSTRSFNNIPSLTTTPKTVISNADEPLEAVSELMISPDTTQLVGTIKQVQCVYKIKCSACDKQLENVDETAKRIKCPNCHLKSNCSDLKKNVTTRINMEDTSQNVHRLVCFQSVMESFLKEENKLELLQNPEQLEDSLLDINKMEFVFGNSSEIISSLKSVD